MNHSDSKDLFPQPSIPGVPPKFQDAAQAAQWIPLAPTQAEKMKAIRHYLAVILEALKQR